MKVFKIVALSAALFLIATCGLYAQAQSQPQPPAQDLSGTWVGETMVQGASDVLALALKKEGDSYTGTISDSMGMLNQTPLQNVKIDKGVLSFFFMVNTGGTDMRVDSIVKPEGSKLSGTWTSEMGDTGTYALERKK